MTLLIAVLLLPVTLITAFFAIEVLFGLPPLRRPATAQVRPSAVIVVPAHDEAKGIVATVAALRDAAAGLADILVVADNCADDTAKLARDGGALVIERVDTERRGKGFALAHAQAFLMSRRPDVVVIIDADCSIDRPSLQRLIARVAESGRPGQTVNLLAPKSGLPSLVQVSNFAFMLKNLVRQRGLQRLAGSAHLTGTGMAMPWAIFGAADLATANIVEDIKLGLELTKAGTPPMLIDDAVVWSDPSGSEGTLRQRERWEGGFLSLARQVAPATVGDGLRRGDLRLALRGVDMAVPPLTLLVGLNLALLGAAVTVTWMTAANWWPVAMQATVLAIGLALIVVAWTLHGRRFLTGRALATMPFYLLWKVPMYLRLRRGKADNWLRAGR